MSNLCNYLLIRVNLEPIKSEMGVIYLFTYYQRGASAFDTSSSNEGEVSVLVISSIANSIISI